MNNDYSDIINLPHHTSTKRPRMSMEQRAAQFAPFAALTGYEDSIIEKGRMTADKPFLSEEYLEEMNVKISIVLANKLFTTFTIFKKDIYKEGGKIERISGTIKKVDYLNKSLILESNEIIQLEDIINIECDELTKYEI